VVTSYPTWSDRILGVSKTARVSTRGVTWAVTGSNVQKTGEIKRRNARIRLVPPVESPWLREEGSFKHGRLLTWARENRRALVEAALTICQAWIAAGRPEGSKTLGSFESYARTLSGVLEVAGVEGFLGNANDPGDVSDDEIRLRALVANWHQHFGSQEVRVAELVAMCEVKTCLMDLLGDKKPDGRTRLLGRILAKPVGRFIGPHQILKTGEDNRGTAKYRLGPQDNTPVNTRPLFDVDLEPTNVPF
jgi:hypothetical protein